MAHGVRVQLWWWGRRDCKGARKLVTWFFSPEAGAQLIFSFLFSPGSQRIVGVGRDTLIFTVVLPTSVAQRQTLGTRSPQVYSCSKG